MQKANPLYSSVMKRPGSIVNEHTLLEGIILLVDWTFYCIYQTYIWRIYITQQTYVQ